MFGKFKWLVMAVIKLKTKYSYAQDWIRIRKVG